MKSLLKEKLSRLAQLAVISSIALLILLVTGCSVFLDEPRSSNSPAIEIEQSNNERLTSFDEVAAYIRANGQLPSNFITKNEAKKLGWIAADGNLHDVAPGKSIGGDRFGNREGLLPKKEGRIWYEADINYEGGHRNADRIVFSNDGLIYMTTDHYKSFTDITDEVATE
ncbi:MULTISPECIES: ribonuclease domain-containing protein [Paenibacillus]|uniref:ribonuclease domain-containing protein n=1 Tax=Paenibacillus TaxID=44249 RepID=UPI0020406CE3|nr:ribonuclease domain-containing protein [Paenibacillus camelliae]MCM3634382.1 ribonuclease [Paenibacillus camelliae]